MTGPIPAPDSQGPQLTSPPWGELSAARILASTGPGGPGSGVMGPSPFEENKSKLQLLHEDKRREYLYQLQEFVVTDNNRNWRFPYELAEQLILILELHNPNYVYDHLMHIALKLCADKVSEVVAILQKFCSNSGSALGFSFIVNSSHGSGTVLSGSEAYFRNAGNPHLGVSEETVLALLSDQNQDLTFFAALEPKRGNVTDPRHAARTELTHL